MWNGYTTVVYTNDPTSTLYDGTTVTLEILDGTTYVLVRNDGYITIPAGTLLSIN